MYCLQRTVINLTDSQKGLFKLQGFSPLCSYQNQLQIGKSIETHTELIHWHIEPFPSLNCILCLSLSFILQHDLTWFWSKGLSWDVNTKIQVPSRPLLAYVSSEQAVLCLKANFYQRTSEKRHLTQSSTHCFHLVKTALSVTVCHGLTPKRVILHVGGWEVSKEGNQSLTHSVLCAMLGFLWYWRIFSERQIWFTLCDEWLWLTWFYVFVKWYWGFLRFLVYTNFEEIYTLALELASVCLFIYF